MMCSIFYILTPSAQHHQEEFDQIFQHGQVDPSHDDFLEKIEKVSVSKSHSDEKLYSPSVPITIAVKWLEQAGVAFDYW